MIDKTDSEGLFSVDHVAGQYKLHRLSLTDEPWQTLSSAPAGYDAQLDLGLAELSFGRSDPDIARQGKLASAAECITVDHGDDRLRKILYRIKGARAAHEFALFERGLACELADVGAPAMNALSPRCR